RAVVEDFHMQWLDLEGLAGAVKDSPVFTPALAQSMLSETRMFAGEVALTSGQNGLEKLLTAPWSYVDAPLAKLYGTTAPAGAGFQRVDLDPQQRAGIFI